MRRMLHKPLTYLDSPSIIERSSRLEMSLHDYVSIERKWNWALSVIFREVQYLKRRCSRWLPKDRMRFSKNTSPNPRTTIKVSPRTIHRSHRRSIAWIYPSWRKWSLSIQHSLDTHSIQRDNNNKPKKILAILKAQDWRNIQNRVVLLFQAIRPSK
jgi:hypothetical protein